jgi:ABC-type Co2+ transport system permease subunit
MDFSVGEFVNRALKYLLEGLAVAVAAIYIPKKALAMDEVATLALTAAAVFALLDVLAPSVGVTARQGAGFGLGTNLIGGLGIRR